MERRVLQVVLVPDSRSRDLLLPVPDLVNGAQDAFNVSLSGAELALDAVPVIDVTEGFAVVGRAKAELGLLTDDLLVMFTPAILEARSHGLTNLFVAGSSIAEKPPRVGILSSSFIRSHILPRDPTYTAQRDALCHLLVCAVAGAFLDMEAHSDRGCVLDFNNFTPNIRHKVDNRYRFCDQCFSIAHHHSLGDALLNMCRALALGVHQARQTSVNAASGGRSVFLCYVRENIDATLGLFAKLQRDGFRPWMDTQSLVPGQEWRSEIGRAIREAGFFVACLSAAFDRRSYGHKEIKLALDVLDTVPEGDIYLIPMRLEECAIPDRLSDRQCVDLFVPHGYDDLVRALRWPRGGGRA